MRTNQEDECEALVRSSCYWFLACRSPGISASVELKSVAVGALKPKSCLIVPPRLMEELLPNVRFEALFSDEHTYA